MGASSLLWDPHRASATHMKEPSVPRAGRSSCARSRHAKHQPDQPGRAWPTSTYGWEVLRLRSGKHLGAHTRSLQISSTCGHLCGAPLPSRKGSEWLAARGESEQSLGSLIICLCKQIVATYRHTICSTYSARYCSNTALHSLTL